MVEMRHVVCIQRFNLTHGEGFLGFGGLNWKEGSNAGAASRTQWPNWIPRVQKLFVLLEAPEKGIKTSAGRLHLALFWCAKGKSAVAGWSRIVTQNISK